jgi:hypothetical protein
MADYSFASEIKFVRTQYLSTSPDMEDLLWDPGFESYMKILLARRTFSASVLQWWIKLQQGLINSGEHLCRTWKGTLQCRFDPPNGKCVHKPTRVAAISSINFLPTKSEMKSFWSDSIISDQCMNNLNHEYSVVAENRNRVMLHNKAKVVAACHIFSPNHYEVKSAILFVENMKLTNDEMFMSAKHCVGASDNSIAAVIPSPKDHQKVLSSTTISHEEQGVQSSCAAENEPPIDDIVDNISTGLSMIAREAKSDGNIVDVNGQCSNIFHSQ